MIQCTDLEFQVLMACPHPSWQFEACIIRREIGLEIEFEDLPGTCVTDAGPQLEAASYKVVTSPSSFRASKSMANIAARVSSPSTVQACLSYCCTLVYIH